MTADGRLGDVLVVGAGVAGLVAARELVLQGHAARVLEAEPVAGGQLRAHELGGLRLDVGAVSFDPRAQSLIDYLGALGLADDVVRPRTRETWLHAADGRTMPLPGARVAGIPAAPLAHDVVEIVGRRDAWRGMLDAVLPGPVGARAASVAELVRRRMGDGILEKLVVPVVEAHYGVHPAAMSPDAVPGLVHHLLRENSLGRAVTRMRLGTREGADSEVDAVASVRGGMSAIIDALGRELDRFGVPIEHGHRVADVQADHVVLATDDPDADGDRIEGTVVVAAPGLLGTGVRTATYVATLVVASPAVAAAPRGSGVVVARGSGMRARRLEHLSATWDWIRAAAEGREVLRLVYDHEPSVEDARRDAAKLLGVDLPPSSVEAATVVAWLRAEPTTATTEIPMVGEHVAGTGVAAVIEHARRTAREFSG